MLDFGGLFDDLPDTLEDYVNTGYSAYKSYQKAQEEENKAMRELSKYQKSSSSTRGGGYSSTPTKAVQSEDPYAFEARWKSRISNYAEIDRMTGVKV